MIGIFDSGIGGLTVAKEILHQLPKYQILYLGDTARTPYGNRSQELIYEFTRQAVEYLFSHGCVLVVLACNTASAEALRRLQQEWLPAHYPDRRILGVIRPLAEMAAQTSRSGRIGVVGTRATVASHTYERELQKLRPNVVVFSTACPLLVPLIEEGWTKRPETMKILRNYLRPLKTKRIDTLILGCTHYPLLYKSFRDVMGKNVRVLDSGAIVAEKLADYLVRHSEIEKRLTCGTNNRFLMTDVTDMITHNCQQWLKRPVQLEKIVLE